MRMILACFFLLASAFLFLIHPAFADDAAFPAGDFNELRPTGTAKVTSVIDPLTLQLHDGRIIRLAGLHYPDLSPHEPGPFSTAALGILKDMLEGQSVTLYLTPKKDWGRTDHMGHNIAQLERQSDKAWVQGSLLQLGLAQTLTSQRNPEMAKQMHALEEKARTEKTGIWEDGTPHAIRTPETAENYLNSLQIVEGQIVSAALKSNRIYLNFGPDWKKDFTVSIAPGDKRLFSKAGIDPLNLGGAAVRVRGWLRSYNGPYIEIDHPEALELISPSENPMVSEDSESLKN